MTPPSLFDASLCGWRIQSELPFAELPAWCGDDRPADVVVRFGQVPEDLDDPVFRGRSQQVGRDGTGLLQPHGIGRFLFQGTDISVHPVGEATEAELQNVILTSGLGFLCHQRGRFPLHASAILRDGRAIAFTGRSGAGKSTLAAALVRRGYRLLADDVTVIDAYAEGGPLVLPTHARLKLWGDAVEALEIETTSAQEIRVQPGKYHLHTPEIAQTSEAIPLAAIVVLEEAAVDEGIETFTSPAASMSLLHGEVYRREIGLALGRMPSLFAAETAIVAKVPVYRWRRPRDHARLIDGADVLMRAIDANGQA